MTLQERILEALGEKALKPRVLYQVLSGENSAAVDAAVSGLMRRGSITLELGHYERARNPVPAPRNTLEPAPAAAVRLSARPSREGPVAATPASAPIPVAQQCKRCGAPKLIEEFARSNLPSGGYLKTCKACMRLATGRRKTAAVVITGKDGVGPLIEIARSPSNEPVKQEAATTPGRMTFSPTLLETLIELQRAKAETVMALQSRLTMVREELAAIEEVVRMATGREA